MALSINDIIRQVAEFYGMDSADLIGAGRDKCITQARHVAMYLASKITGKSLPVIGRAFGGRDHTTVLHATRKISQMLKGGDRKLGQDVDALFALLAPHQAGRLECDVQDLRDEIEGQIEAIFINYAQAMERVRHQKKLINSLRYQLSDQAYTGLKTSVEAVMKAHKIFQADRFTRGERHSLEALDQAMADLSKTYQNMMEKINAADKHADE